MKNVSPQKQSGNVVCSGVAGDSRLWNIVGIGFATVSGNGWTPLKKPVLKGLQRNQQGVFLNSRHLFADVNWFHIREDFVRTFLLILFDI